MLIKNRFINLSIVINEIHIVDYQNDLKNTEQSNDECIPRRFSHNTSLVIDEYKDEVLRREPSRQLYFSCNGKEFIIHTWDNRLKYGYHKAYRSWKT